MRPVALSPKNWTRIGGPWQDRRGAGSFQSWKAAAGCKSSVHGYFSTIRPGIADLPIRGLQSEKIEPDDFLQSAPGRDDQCRPFRSGCAPIL
jgi:hypothetical protein